VSPFNWTVYVSDEDVHRFAHINLVRKEAKTPPTDSSHAWTRRILPLAEARWETRARFGSRAKK
jgi:hypothetical protein